MQGGKQVVRSGARRRAVNGNIGWEPVEGVMGELPGVAGGRCELMRKGYVRGDYVVKKLERNRAQEGSRNWSNEEGINTMSTRGTGNTGGGIVVYIMY